MAAPDLAAEAPLSPLHLEIRGEAEVLAAEFADRAREVRLSAVEQGRLHPELWERFSERGWAGFLVPPKYGGSEGGLLAMTVVLESLSASNLTLWMPVLSSAIAHAIAEVGPEPAREQWLERVASGEVSLALAATEPGCGHNLFRVATTVRPEDGGYVVTGLKAVTSGVDIAERVLVFGRAPREDDDGPARYTTVLVDPNAEGAVVSPLAMGGREGVNQYELRLEDVEVPAGELVGAEGQGLLALWPFTHVERILTAALSIGATRYCLTRSIDRAKQRAIFGKRPIGAEQAISHPLANLHARLEAARLLVYRTAARFDAGVDGFVVSGESNLAKVLAADLVYDAADQAVQTLGADAWDEREGMLDAFLDARLARSGPISQELALNFIAQHVLGLPSHG